MIKKEMPQGWCHRDTKQSRSCRIGFLRAASRIRQSSRFGNNGDFAICTYIRQKKIQNRLSSKLLEGVGDVFIQNTARRELTFHVIASSREELVENLERKGSHEITVFLIFMKGVRKNSKIKIVNSAFYEIQ